MASSPGGWTVAAADTDSVALQAPAVQTTAPDTGRVDGPEQDSTDTRLLERYLSLQEELPLPGARPPRERPLMPELGSYWQHQVQLDSLAHAYTWREMVGDQDVRAPLQLDYQTYRRERLDSDLERNWSELIAQRERQRQREQGRGGLGVNISVPGGRQSAFSTIFGKPQVDLRVNGQAQITAGFNYRSSDQQASFTGRASRLDPNFKQDLRLGITGTIGDKLRVNVDWDTNSQFDYQNQLKLDYTGYQDDIIQSIEAGNVYLETSSTLINTGQKLFGIKSQMQLGGVNITTVASQEKGQANMLSLEGGVQTREFSLQPIDYDSRRHFFLAYHFRNWWEDALENPPTLRLFQNFEEIIDIEVWRLQTPNRTDEQRNVVALVDLGERPALLEQADAYTDHELPSQSIDQYEETELESSIRMGSGTATYLETATENPLNPSDYQMGSFVKLDPQQDYELHESLGYISLNQSLNESQALAVAFKYRTSDGEVHQIGDFVSDMGGSNNTANEKALALKLLRPTLLKQPSDDKSFNPAAWYLEMRNIYSLRGSNFNADNFELDIYYEPSASAPQQILPEVQGQSTLLQLLGLDRLNSSQAARPDNEFDFIPSYTIDPRTGRLIFPYLEPFGQRMSELTEEAPPELRNHLVLSNLYTQKKNAARDNTGLDIYTIQGSSSGSQPSFYDLGAYAGLVEGSVRVTADNIRLQEGRDYVVDYQSGTVQITDPSYLTAGRQINISYEQNQMFSIQKKTLLGARADYSLADKLDLGVTLMSLSEKSPVDKFRIGEEPINNLIVGLDGALNLEPRWLTWAVDALPLIQTKAPSAINFTGEIAQLRPGHGQTTAFERERDRLGEMGLDFHNDELQGISYIDAFEGFENTYSLKNPGSWRISSVPDSIGRHPPAQQGAFGDSLRSNWRAAMGWYQVNQNTLSQVIPEGEEVPAAARLVPIRSVFPDRPISQANYLETFDIYFDPNARGPYNYTTNLDGFLDSPKDTWGGMAMSLPEGYKDFDLKNVEFVEFVFRPYPKNNSRDAGDDAKLYMDLGSISEDVVPNEELNNEDGLALTTLSRANLDPWSRLPGSTQNNSLDLTEEEPLRTEDLGLDGLASYMDNTYDARFTEQRHYADFLNSLDGLSGPEVTKARRDPSGDDFHNFDDDVFFEDKDLFPNGASVQERFLHFFPGQELNGYETQSKLANGRGNSRYPDSEDLNINSTVDTRNSYFQYELPLGRDQLDSLASNGNPDDYVINQIEADGQKTGWYLIRIPVRKPDRSVGNSNDFSLIESIRLWTTGHHSPITMRFASMELVGSQWRKSSKVELNPAEQTQAGNPSDDTRLTISSLNNEENDDVYEVPLGTVRKQFRSPAGGVPQDAREQALVMNLENLKPQQQRAIYKTYNQGMDMLKYSNLRMFAHLEGRTADGTPLNMLPEEEARGKVRLFIRLGSNETEDYYEYEMPLSPSPPGSGNDPNAVWQTNQLWNGETLDLNSVNIDLAALNRLKVARDQQNARVDTIFWHRQEGRTIVEGVEEFASPGTRIGIKGTPSLANINSIVIGVRNPAPENSLASEDELERVEVWVNELRVAGYDQSNGWSALSNADIQLADFGQLRGNFQQQVAGFGSLSSTLDDRDRNAENSWSLTTNLNLDKFIPEQYGWRLPLSLQFKSRTSTPEFAPSRGDVRVQEIIEQIERNESLAPEQRNELVTRTIHRAQTHRQNRSITARLSKNNSESPWLRKTLDGLSLRYSYSDRQGRSPSLQLNDSWRWTGALDYRVTAQPQTLNLFGFLDGLPFLGLLSDLAWNYIPSSLSFGTNASRRFSATRDRPTLDSPPGDLPPSVRYRLRDRQSFDHRRNFDLQYNPFEFLTLGFDNSTDQNLNLPSADTLSSVVVVNNDTGQQRILHDMTLAQARRQNRFNSQLATGYQIDSLDVLPTGRVLRNVFFGDGPRTETYDQRFSATFQPNTSDNKWLDWIQPQDFTYQVDYEWDNGPVGQPTGATAGNRTSFKAGVNLSPQDFWRKFGFYKKLEQEQKQAEAKGEQSAAADSTAEQGFELPLPSLRSLFRQSVLAVTGIQDFNISYTGNRGATSSNVGRPVYRNGNVVEASSGYGLFDAFRGSAPSPRYLFGLDRRIANDFRVLDPGLQVRDELTNSNRLQARTTLTPTSNLRINLNWSAEWHERNSITLNRNHSGIERAGTSSGSNRTSIWAFGASYRDLFERQLETYRGDFQNADTLMDRNGDGRVVLTHESVSEDFRRAFSNGFGTIDSRNTLPLPMPGWSVSYSGLSQWPLLSNLAQRVTLRHIYNATYSTDFRSNESPEGASNTFALGPRIVRYGAPAFRANAAGVNERFSPLLGIQVRWKGGVQTDLSWNKNNS